MWPEIVAWHGARSGCGASDRVLLSGFVVAAHWLADCWRKADARTSLLVELPTPPFAKEISRLHAKSNPGKVPVKAKLFVVEGHALVHATSANKSGRLQSLTDPGRSQLARSRVLEHCTNYCGAQRMLSLLPKVDVPRVPVNAAPDFGIRDGFAGLANDDGIIDLFATVHATTCSNHFHEQAILRRGRNLGACGNRMQKAAVHVSG